MPSLSVIKCPECGGNVNVAPGQLMVRCEYCGATSAIKATQMGTVPSPMAPPGPGPMPPYGPPPPYGAPPQYPGPGAAPLRVPFSASPRRRGGLAIVLTLFPLLMVGGIVLFVTSNIRSAVNRVQSSIQQATRAVSAKGPRWDGAPPMLARVDGDAVDDVIGWIDRLPAGEQGLRVAAFSGASGDLLWQTDAVATNSDQHTARVAVAGNRVLVADPGGQLRVFELATGKPAFAMPLGERADRFCAPAAAAAGTVDVVTTDGRRQHVDLAAGTLTAAGAGKRRLRGADPDCAPLWNDHGPSTPLATVATSSDGDMPRVDGMSVDATVQEPGGPLLLVGAREPGTRVPMAASYTGGRKVAWQAAIPSGNPLDAREGAPEQLGLGAGKLVLPYQLTAGEWRVTCFDAATGARLWDVAVPSGFTTVLSGVVVGRDRVFVALWGRLHAFDPATGRLAWTLGV